MVRDYVYVADAVAMICDTVGVATAHSVYNIGSGVGTSVTELLHEVEAVTGVAPRIDRQPVPPYFVHRSVLDTGRFRGEFGEPATRSLREGVTATWEAIRGEAE
jgi:UDP-glucose 4-epimerase